MASEGDDPRISLNPARLCTQRVGGAYSRAPTNVGQRTTLQLEKLQHSIDLGETLVAGAGVHPRGIGDPAGEKPLIGALATS